MGSMSYGGALTHTSVKAQYATCRSCDKVYQDDVPVQGNVKCPNCKLMVERGLTMDEAKGLLVAEQRELLE